MADKRDCLITAFKHHAPDVEMDIPFCTDLIPQTAVKYDTVPYTYRLQASVVKDVFFEFFQVLFFPWLYQLIKFRIRLKFRDWSVVHTDYPFGSYHLQARIHSWKSWQDILLDSVHRRYGSCGCPPDICPYAVMPVKVPYCIIRSSNGCRLYCSVHGGQGNPYAHFSLWRSCCPAGLQAAGYTPGHLAYGA